MKTFLDRAQRAVSAGIAYARERDLKMTIVVLDITGTVCAAARMDRSRTITYEIARAKANTAREFQTSTAELKELIKPENKIAIQSLAPRIAFLGGGLPITVAGEQIGALGTSGGAEDQDIECADVCLAAGFGGA